MAYSNTNYTRYRHKPNIITPPKKIEAIQVPERIQEIKPIQPIYGYSSLTSRQNKYKQLQQDKQTQTFLANYNAPTELNSYIDALVNREAVSKRFGETWGAISTASGTASLVANIASIVISAVAWIVSLFLPDFGAIGVAGQAGAAGISAAGKGAAAATTAANVAKGTAAAAKAVKVANASAKVAKAATATVKAAKAVKVSTKAIKAAKAAKTLNTLRKTAKGLKTASRLFAIPAIPAMVDVTIEKGIKPIVAGKPKEAALNMLMNLGETMDWAANPIKGLFLEGGEGFVKGLGLSDAGRVNYDYDTGFFLTDMLLETISDPLNWMSVTKNGIKIPFTNLGIKGAADVASERVAKQAINPVVENAINTINKNATTKIAKEGTERISKRMTRATAQVSRDWAEAVADNFTQQAEKIAIRSGKNFKWLSKTEKDGFRKIAQKRMLEDGRGSIQRSLVRALRKEMPDATAVEIDRLLKKAGKESVQELTMRTVTEQIQDITFDTLSSQTIKSLANLQHYTDDFQRFMTKGAMLSSGYGLGVEAVKDGWKGIKTWMNNRTISALKRASVFDNANGLDIKQWAKAKKIWEAGYKYASDLAGDISQRDMNAFYAFASQQFNRDRQLISRIMQDGTDPLKKAGQISGQIQALYNCDFETYVGFIKGINNAENDVYKHYVKYLENTLETLGSQAYQKGAGEAIKAGKSLFNVHDVAADNILQKIQTAVKTSKDTVELTDKFYTLKMNNAYVNAMLVNDKTISDTLMEINGSERVGALLDKITGDLNALAPEVAAQIPVAVRTIKEAGASFMNIKNFYNEVAGMPLAKIKGISDTDFRKYVIDQIFGDNKTVAELLAEFDSITMPALKNGLETLLADTGFKFIDYPTLEDQIAGVYRRFLEAQQLAQVERLGATIVQDFTTSIDDLINYLPQYADDLQELAGANFQIKAILAQVKSTNIDLLENIFTTKATIFNVANPRQLTDAGLALKTVALKQNLDMFNLTNDMSGNIINSANRLGKSLKQLKESLEQYQVYFDDKKAKAINNAYTEFRKQFLDNPEFTATLEHPAFRYIKSTKNSVEQFAQLVEFNKLAKDKLDAKQFKSILQTYLGTTEYMNVLDPSGLMVTDFAWDAMAQSAWIAEKQFNEGIINGITAYKNLSLSSKKATNDFQAIRDVLSTNKIDLPKMLQQERYIKAAAKFNELFEFIEQHYASRFNKTLAAEELESVRNILINFPELNNKYSDLVDTLEAYWNGEKTFKQSPKEDAKLYNQARREMIAEYKRLNAGLPPDDAAMEIINQELHNQFGVNGIIDEFTPFWEDIKAMNQEIQETLQRYNETVPKAERINYKNITPWDPIKEQQELNKLIMQATDANAKGAFYNLFSLTPEEFINELAYRRRFITFNETDVDDAQLKAMFNKFNHGNKRVSSTEFVDVYQSANGWYSVHDKQNHRYWYVLDGATDKKGKPLHPETYKKVNMSGRQIYLNDNPIMRLQKQRSFNEFKIVDDYIADANNPGLVKTLNELEDSLETLTGSRLGDSQGEYLSQGALEQIYMQMPEEVQGLLPSLEEWTDKQFFDAYIFNESILGSSKSKRELGMLSSNQIVNTRNAIVGAQGYLKPRNEYVNAVFDSQLSISSPNSIWSTIADEDLLEALQAYPEYKLVTLVDDKKYGMKVRDILPTSVEAIKKVRETGGWIIPTQTYKDMYNVVNHRIGSTGMAKLWSRIMYSYKFGYLMRPGAWIRNWIDTNLKSRFEMGSDYKEYNKQAHDILDDVNAMKKSIKDIEDTRLKEAWKEYGDLAQKLFDDKDRIEKFIQRRSKDGYIREDAIKAWFENPANPKKILTYDTYKELNDTFLSQGISGNVMADLYKTEGGDLWNTFTQVTGNIVEFGNKTENYNRLAMYLYELDQGLDYTSALSKLAKTHFDYSFKTRAEQIAETVFPFSTFSMRNYSYWIEMIEKHPWLMRNYVHLMKPHWDFKDYTPEELARDQRVQSQILYGQLKLGEFNDKVITFKANPSIQDALQMFSDPINNVYEKLAAPLAAVRDTAIGQDVNINNLIPIAGPVMQAGQQVAKTGTPLPSAIGVQPTPKRKGQVKANGKWSNSNLSETDKYTDDTYRTPKYRKNMVYDSYAVKGVKRYRLNMYPIVDVAHDIKMRYSTNVYNRIKNRVQQDVYKGIRYRIRLDVNRFR